MPNNIHLKHLLDMAKASYTNLKHFWGPATDGQPTQESALIAKLEQMEALIATLNSGKKDDTSNDGKDDSWKTHMKCHFCNKVRHFKRDCPKARNSQNNYSKPKEGKTTRTIDGKLWKWCAKCCRSSAKASEKGMRQPR